jgi:hypothetical protein
VGPGRILEYVLQGLYHPARFVRDAYWKIYNSLYICGQDALTPVYPRYIKLLLIVFHMINTTTTTSI